MHQIVAQQNAMNRIARQRYPSPRQHHQQFARALAELFAEDAKIASPPISVFDCLPRRTSEVIIVAIAHHKRGRDIGKTGCNVPVLAATWLCHPKWIQRAFSEASGNRV